MPDLTLTTVDGTWVNNPADDPSLYLDAGELRRAAAALISQGGIGRGLEVTVDGSDQVEVAPGAAVIDGDAVAPGTGVYQAGIPAAATGQLEARDATNARVNLVVIRQYDPDVVPAHGTRKPAVEVLTGVPAAAPTARALPALAVELAQIAVPPAGGGAAAVDESGRTYAAAVNGDGNGDSTVPELQLIRTSAQTLPNNTTTTIVWQAAPRNVGGMWTSGGSVTITRPGLYAIDVSVQTGGHGTGPYGGVEIYLNGSSVAGSGGTLPIHNEGNEKNATTTRRLALGDVITFRFTHNHSSTLAVQPNGGAGTRANINFIRA